MREKSPRLIVTFHTTAGAIATEQTSPTPGGWRQRWISVPGHIRLRHGLVRAAEPEHLETRVVQGGRGIETAGFASQPLRTIFIPAPKRVRSVFMREKSWFLAGLIWRRAWPWALPP